MVDLLLLESDVWMVLLLLFEFDVLISLCQWLIGNWGSPGRDVIFGRSLDPQGLRHKPAEIGAGALSFIESKIISLVTVDNRSISSESRRSRAVVSSEATR